MNKPFSLSWLNLRLNELHLAASLLTRLPLLPMSAALSDNSGAPANSVWAFPLIGFVIGGIAALSYSLAAFIGLPAQLCAIAAMAASFAATGLFHEDGLADFTDSFGARSKEEKHNIMRDSHIGTYGVAALFISLLSRWAVLSNLLFHEAVIALIITHITSRSLIAFHYLMLSPARSDGLAAKFGHPSQTACAVSLIIGIAALVLTLPLPAALMVFSATLGACLILTLLVKHTVQGYTGDTLGANEQVAEIAILMTLAALWSAN